MRANTTIESISSKPHELRAPLHGVLAPGKCVHTVRSIASVAEIYECSLAAIQGIPVQGAARVRLPFVARNAAAGVEATPGVDNPAPVELPPETPTRAVGAAPEPRPERVTSTILPPPPPPPAPPPHAPTVSARATKPRGSK